MTTDNMLRGNTITAAVAARTHCPSLKAEVEQLRAYRDAVEAALV